MFVEKREQVCRKHGLTVHYRIVDKRSGYARWRCRRCIGEAVLRRKQWIRRVLVVEGGDRCQSCGYRRLQANLHFHHLDPGSKQFELTTGNGKSLARFREEARKCVLVCANCHGEIEAGIRRAPPSMVERVRLFNLKPLTFDDLLRGQLA
jgi:hypothetical protein